MDLLSNHMLFHRYAHRVATPYVLVAAIWCLSALTLGCSQEAPPSPHRIVIGEKALMAWILEPAADVYWDAVGDVLELVDGEVVETHFEPSTNEEWTAVRNAAAVIAESGNLLLMGERWRDQGQWQELAQQLVDAGEQAILAAEARDPQRVFDEGANFYEICRACHEAYWPESQWERGAGVPRSVADEE